MTSACQDCGQPTPLNAILPDPAWKRIRPNPNDPPGGGGILCLHCIDDRLAEHGITSEVKLYWKGEAAYAVSAGERWLTEERSAEEHYTFAQEGDAP